MGWFFCFKPRFNISIEKNCLLRNEDEKDGEWEPGKDTETHQEDVTGNKSSAFISGCANHHEARIHQCNLRDLPTGYCLPYNPPILSLLKVLLQACPKIMLK